MASPTPPPDETPDFKDLACRINASVAERLETYLQANDRTEPYWLNAVVNAAIKRHLDLLGGPQDNTGRRNTPGQETACACHGSCGCGPTANRRAPPARGPPGWTRDTSAFRHAQHMHRATANGDESAAQSAKGPLDDRYVRDAVDASFEAARKMHKQTRDSPGKWGRRDSK